MFQQSDDPLFKWDTNPSKLNRGISLHYWFWFLFFSWSYWKR